MRPTLVNEKPVELGKLSAETVAKGEQFADAMMAEGLRYAEIMDNFRKLLFRHAIASEGNVQRAATALKTHRNVIFSCIAKNRAYFTEGK